MVSALDRNDVTTLFRRESCRYFERRAKKPLRTASIDKDGLYTLNLRSIRPKSNAQAYKLKVWHKRLGQKNNETVSEMKVSENVKGVNLNDKHDTVQCKAWAEGKQIRGRQKEKPRSDAYSVGDTILSDIRGP